MVGLRLSVVLLAAAFLMAFALPRSYEGHVLHVLAFPNAMDEGVIRDFEISTGATVEIDVYGSNLDLVDEIDRENIGQFDVLLASEGMLLPLSHRGVLLPLDLERLPNRRHVDFEQFQGAESPYGMPYVSGITGLAYRRDLLRIPPKSWKEVLDGAGPWSGEVWLLRDRRLALGVSLKALGRSVNEEQKRAVTQAGRWLEARSGTLRGLESLTHLERLQAGDGLVAQAHYDEVLALGDRRIGFLVPQEGGIYYNDVAALGSILEEEELAYRFVDHMLHPLNARRISRSLGRSSPSRGARRFGGIGVGPHIPHLAALLNECILPVRKTALAFDVAWERLLRVVEGR